MIFGKPISISGLKRWIRDARICGAARAGSVPTTGPGPMERSQAQRLRTEAPHTKEISVQPTNEQLAALNTWEDEGGRTAEPTKAVGNRHVGRRHATQEQ